MGFLLDITTTVSDDLLIWAIGFIATQFIAFIVFTIRMWMKLEALNVKTNEWVVNMNIRLEDLKRSFDADVIELKTDIEDHKIAYENRIRDLIQDLNKKYDKNCAEDRASHDSLQKDITFIKESISDIRETIGFMRGSMKAHHEKEDNDNGNSSSRIIKKRTKQ